MNAASPSTSTRLKVAAAVVGIVLIAGLGWMIRENLREQAEIGRLEAMRERLGDLRTDVDECRLALARQEDAFNRFDARVDSLRGLISDLEKLDPRGVPGERYEEYLSTFDEYNSSVPEWESQADSLEVHLATCRRLAERHNALADSLRTLLEKRRTDDD